MEDIFKPRGATKASQPDAGGAVVRNVPVFAIVKDNIDPVRMGRIRVYISDIGGEDPDNSDNWVTVGYMSTFLGQTASSGGTTGYGEYAQNPSSYGVWNSPPDIGSTVICIFINGDSNYGYYIGCVPQAETLFMVPAIGSSSNVVLNQGEASGYGGAKRLPVTNLNTNNDGIVNSTNFLNEARPVHSYMASTMSQQGLIRDPIRGPISSSAQRESPSRVGWGVSTPGRPIYEGGYTDENITDQLQSAQPQNLKVIGRRAGHTFVMDDGDISGQDQLVRIRTSLGHQILLSDSGQCLTIIHANGQSYVELGKEGTVDVFSTNSVNVRTQGDLNLHADNNINIQATKELNIACESFNLNVDTDTNIKTDGNFNQSTQGTHGVKASGALSIISDGEAGLTGSTAFVSGSQVNLNTGSPSFTPSDVTALKTNQHPDTLNDNTAGWIAAPGKLASIVSRAPAHMPWAAANQGVDVEVSGSASNELPSDPSPQVSEANNSVDSVPVPSVNSAISSTVPDVTSVSPAINPNVTGSLVGQTSVLAATNPLTQQAALNGKGIIETGGGKVASLGALAQTPAQLEAAGYLKPGSAPLVDSLVSQGKSIEQAMPSSLFTGKDGTDNVQTFINSTPRQVKVATDVFKQAQTTLVSAGVITGKESSTQIAGLVLSTANQGLNATTNIMKNATGLVAGMSSIAQSPNSLLGTPDQLINAGKTAANYAENVTSGLTSVSDTIGNKGLPNFSGLNSSLTSLTGLVSNAFNTAVSSLPKLVSGIPQNLSSITKQNNQAINSETSGIAETIGSSSGLGGIQGGVKSVMNMVNKSVDQLGSSLSNIGKSITSGDSSNLLSSLRANSSNANSLTSLIPSDGMGALKTALGAMGANSPAGLKLATAALDTYNRSSISSQLNSLLGNPKIPAPNYGGNSATFNEDKTESLLKDQVAKAKAKDELIKQLEEANMNSDRLNAAWADAYTNLPSGDPEIQRLKSAFLESIENAQALRKQIYG